MSAPVIAHRNVAVVVFTEPRLLEEVRALVPLDEYVLAKISPTELIVDPARVGELAARLSERGLPPLVKKARPAEERWVEEDTAPVGEVTAAIRPMGERRRRSTDRLPDD